MNNVAIELYRSVALAACEAISPEASLLKCIGRICSLLDWEVGHVYLPLNQEDTLSSGSLWFLADPVRFTPFKEFSESIVFTPGLGLVGKVFESGEAQGIPEIAESSGFLRAEPAIATGLRSAFAFPLRTCTEQLGVVEFFSSRPGSLDPEVFKTVAEIVRLLARVLKRKRTEWDVFRKAANSDALTHLPNRSMLSHRLKEALGEAKRNGKEGAVLFLDLDRFKLINETLGHEAGDRLLRGVAERLLPFAGRYDYLARLGGDEFTLLLPDLASPQAAADAAQAILDAFEKPFLLDGHSIYLTISIGASIFLKDGEDAATLMKHASIALNLAKKHPGKVLFYQNTMQAPTSERLILEHHLRHALDSDQLVLHYQPQICLNSGALIGAEVLVRWQHPDLGLIPPGKFIPLAEETGLIMPMTEHILRKACERGHAWLSVGLPPLQLAVNLSGLHFKRKGLDATILKTLEETGFPARRLELELTEGILMENVEGTIATLNRLNSLGIQFAVDDFGTGYSSLSYLKRFPLNVLKIDQSFVRSITTSPEDRAIVSAIIALAHRLHLKVIAEGVETEDQLGFLQEHACDYAQGYLFSRPLAESAFEQLLASGRPMDVGRFPASRQAG